MGLYLIYRSPYYPSFKFQKKFEENTILEWFQSFWEMNQEDYDVYCEQLYTKLGTNIYGVNDSLLSESIYEGKASMPQNYEELIHCLQEHSYVNKVFMPNPHLLQIYTDDDETDLAYYLIEENYLIQNPVNTKYLLQDAFDLPTNVDKNVEMSFKTNIEVKKLTGNKKNTDSVYFAFFSSWGNNSIHFLEEFNNGAFCIERVSLKELPSFLLQQELDVSVPQELLLIKSQIKPEQSIDEVIINLKSIPFTQTNSFDSSLSKVFFSEHLIQVSFHTGKIKNKDTYDYWIIFDDLWATTHPALANSILNFTIRWNVLR